MARIETVKSGLSDIFVKFRVSDDHVTCSPLMKNNEIL